MPLPEIDRSVELFSLPGHDRDCAKAMLSQARLRTRPLDDLQVAHLISIGYRAGVAAGEVRGRTAAAADLPSDTVGILAWLERHGLSTTPGVGPVLAAVRTDLRAEGTERDG
jgi:hypothetical protein